MAHADGAPDRPPRSSRASSTCSTSCRSSAIAWASCAASTKTRVHWVGVAVRESVINAIKHGNRERPRQARHRRVRRSRPSRRPTELVVRVSDQGDGLRPRRRRRSARAREHAQVERPRHLPHAQLHGRRAPRSARRRAAWKCAWSSSWRRTTVPERRPRPSTSPPPSKPVIRAGAMQHRAAPARCTSTRRARSISSRRSIVAVERMFRALDRRALSRSRRAGRGVRGARRPRARSRCTLGVRSRRRHDELRARPADLLLVAARSRSTATPVVAAVYDPSRRELFTAERGGGAWLNGEPLRVSVRRAAHRLAARAPAFRTPCRNDPGRARRPLRRVPPHVARGSAPGFGGDRSLLRRGGPAGRLLGEQLKPWDIAAGALLVPGGGGRRHRRIRRNVRLAPRGNRRLERAHSRRDGRDDPVDSGTRCL